MISYHLNIALRSIRSSILSSLLAIFLVAFGISAGASLVAIQFSMAGDPFPNKSDRLFHVQIDTRPALARQSPMLDGLSFSDAHELSRLPLGASGVTSTYASILSIGLRGEQGERQVSARAVSGDFFVMFDVPIRAGRTWTTDEEESRSHVVLVSEQLSQDLYGGQWQDKELVVKGVSMRVIGVIDDWRPAPKFYDLSGGAFSKNEDIYLPLSTSVEIVALPSTLHCWADPGHLVDLKPAPCGWLQTWIELESGARGSIVEQTLISQLRDIGLDNPESRIRIVSLSDWLSEKNVIPAEIKLQTLIGLAMLAMCATIMSGIMLLKYHDRGRELAIRRAMGASLVTIAGHIWTESLLISFSGVLLGILMSFGVVQGVKLQGAEYSDLIQFDWTTVSWLSVTGLALSVTGSLAALIRVRQSTMTALIGRLT